MGASAQSNMKKLLTVCTFCLVALTLVAVQRRCDEHRRARVAEAALTTLINAPPLQTKFDSGAAGTSEALFSDDPPLNEQIVTLAADGNVSVCGQPAGHAADTASIRERLVECLRERARPERAMVVKARRQAEYEQLNAVVDAVKAAGAKPIRLEVVDK